MTPRPDMLLRIRRAYAPREPDDGVRVLVDRLWPRGLARASAGIDLWWKDAAPSSELRRWFSHRPERWESFRRKYLGELVDRDVAWPGDAKAAPGQAVTLLYAASDQRHNHAIVLKKYLENRDRT